jgi:hypothetical protein
MTVQGPTETVSQAVAMAEPVPEATMQATTSSVTADAMDSGLQELIAERAAMLEFDAGLGRDEADRMALAMVMGPEPAAAGGPVHQDVVGGNCILQLPRTTAANQAGKGPSPAQRPVMPPGSPAESDRRSFASDQGGLWSPSYLRQLNPWGG